MSFIDRRIRLFDNADSLGLTCGPSGVSLAGVPLLVATPSGYAPRPAQEIGDLLKAAYGASLEPARLTPGLAVIAEALNRADLGRAMVAALHLRLPALGADDAARLAKAVESLAKFNRDQPRDWHGRWTADGGTAPSNASSPTPGQRPGQRGTGDEDRPHLDPSQPPRSKGPSHTAGSVVPEAQGGWRKPAHLYGGRLIPIQGGGAGSNFPPPDPVPVPEAEPNINAPSVPLGWDNHGHTKDGITYPTVRVPRLPNGSPWPRRHMT